MADEAREEDGLREVPASEILAKIEKGEPVEYDHYIVKGDLDISKLNLPKRHANRSELEIDSIGLAEDIIIINSIIKLTNAKIIGISNFSEAAFDQEAEFLGTTFIGNASFSGSFFNGPSDFTGAQFRGDAHFDGSQFNGGALFEGCLFNKWAGFSLLQVKGIADFSECQFNDCVDFLRSQFNEYIIDFRRSNFKGTAEFSVVNQ
jgi:uncharacterized protein YjbI with pentapeptide repeats